MVAAAGDRLSSMTDAVSPNPQAQGDEKHKEAARGVAESAAGTGVSGVSGGSGGQEPFGKMLRRYAVDVVLIVGWLCLAATVFASFSGLFWWLDLLTHFRVLYASALLLSVIAAIVGKSWRQAGCLNLALVINLYLIAPLWTETQANPPADGGPSIRLVQLNVLTSNTAHEETLAFLEESQGDVLVLQEVNSAWMRVFREGLVGYDIAAQSPREDNFGMAVLVKKGVLEGFDAQIFESEATGLVPQIQLSFEMAGVGQGADLSVLAVHTLPPVSREYDRVRHAQIESVRRWSGQQKALGRHRVVIGDLNASYWSRPFRRLIAETDLRDSSLGFGHQGSFPANLPAPCRIGIDHVLISPAIRVDSRALGRATGSDHLPVVVDLSLTGVVQPPVEQPESQDTASGPTSS